MRFSFAGVKSEFLASESTIQTMVHDTGAIAPHAKTVRVLYTVPAAKRATLLGAFCRMEIITNGAGTGLGESGLEINGAASIGIASLAGLATSSAGSNANIAGGADIGPGDTFGLWTESNITGGTARYWGYAAIREYDA